MNTHIGLHSSRGEDRLTTDFSPNKSFPNNCLTKAFLVFSRGAAFQKARGGGFQRESGNFESPFRLWLMEHYPGESTRRPRSGTHGMADWLLDGSGGRGDAGFSKALERPCSRFGGGRSEQGKEDTYGRWSRRGLRGALSLGTDMLLPAKCRSLLKHSESSWLRVDLVNSGLTVASPYLPPSHLVHPIIYYHSLEDFVTCKSMVHNI